MMTKISKQWAVAIACWAVLLSTGFLSQHLSTVEKVPIKKPFQEFPYRVGEDWIGKGQYSSGYMAGALGADQYFLRNYHDDIGNNMELYFAYFENIGAGKGPHAPQLCWIGSGWAFKALGDEIIALGSKKTQYAVVKKILAEREGQRVLLFYCYKLNDRYFTDFGFYRIYAVLDTLFKRKNSAFTLQLTSDAGEGDYSIKEKMMKDFLSKTLTILEDEFLP